MENLLMKWRTSEAGAAVMMCGGAYLGKMFGQQIVVPMEVERSINIVASSMSC